MAFTNSQKVKIRHFLGFPAASHLDRNSRLESSMDLTGEDADASALVTGILTSLAAVETELASSLAQAGLKRAEDVEWFQAGAGSAVIEQKRDEGRRYCNQLSIIFGVPIVNDVFSQRGYAGDTWKGDTFQNSRNIIPLG